MYAPSYLLELVCIRASEQLNSQKDRRKDALHTNVKIFTLSLPTSLVGISKNCATKLNIGVKNLFKICIHYSTYFIHYLHTIYT